MAESAPFTKALAKALAPVPASAPVSSWVRPLVEASMAFSDAYAEHLNHHCAKCTQAWDKLKTALEAVPPR